MKRDWWDKEIRALVTMGDSITAGGWSSCRERCWAKQLTCLINEFQRVPVHLINAGIGANLISPRSPLYPYSGKPSASERLQEHVIDNHPDLLVMAHGACDAAAGTPVELFREDLHLLIQRIREQIQPLIVLLGMYYMSDLTAFTSPFRHADQDVFRRYNFTIKQVAEENDCLFVDLLSSYREADWLVHHDGLHGNDLGHRLVANRIFEVLASNCSGLALETKALEQSIAPWRDESTLQAN
ncbi:MAG: SGNH/GDSL hydrolase family protein [Armatimonadetes bacterium]|nr:SGNH/GDSL hydrolase family protein [Armatimonadota bacterium]